MSVIEKKIWHLQLSGVDIGAIDSEDFIKGSPG